MKSNRTRLREEIGTRFLPELRKVGFEGPDSIRGNTPVHEFRRPGPRSTDVLTIQLEKRGLPRFVVRLHVEPPAGIDEVMARGGAL